MHVCRKDGFTRFSVKTGRGKTNVICGAGAATLPLPLRSFFLTDTNVFALYKDRFPFPKDQTLVLDFGESVKSVSVLEQTLQKMQEKNLERKSTLVVVGGGTVGDLGALCASLYMRGISLVMIPTTLLSQADSALGGKTAIDFGNVKNSVGTFYPADEIRLDPTFLKTLPDREIRSGLGEIVKCSALDKKIATALKTADFGNAETLFPLAVACAKLKAKYVRKDEYDLSVRHALNLGHTTAHAIELSSGLAHGECVLLGLYAECDLARSFGADESFLCEIERNVLRALDGAKLPNSWEFSSTDKKDENGKKGVVLPVNYGKIKEVFLEKSDFERNIESGLNKLKGKV